MKELSLSITVISFILFLGVSLNRFSKFFKMPILVCFLGVGIVFGPYCLNLFGGPLNINDVQLFGEIALCFIMFSGGLQTSFKSIKSVFATGTILATVGVILTALITAVFWVWISQMSLFITATYLESLLLAAVFASTDAAAVFAILRGQKAAINPRLQGLLEYESGSNDPAAFLLTSVMISIVFSKQSVDVLGVSWIIGKGIVWGLGMGAIIGFSVGIFGQWFFNWLHSFLDCNGLRYVVAIAIVFFCYGITDLCFEANSLMSCYVAGITMGNIEFDFKKPFIRFSDGISWLMQILLFSVLGTFFDYHALFKWKLIVGSLLCAFVLMFIARPVTVLLCMIRSPFTLKERFFTCWVGIRGSAPIMLAALVLASAPASESSRINNVFYSAFIIVLLSVLIQGSSLMWVAQKLGLIMPFKEQEDDILEYRNSTDGRVMCQFTVPEGCALIDKNIADARKIAIEDLQSNNVKTMPILLIIRRNGICIDPQPDEVLQVRDTLCFLGKPEVMQVMHRLFFRNEMYSISRTFRQLWNDFIKRFQIVISTVKRFLENIVKK